MQTNSKVQKTPVKKKTVKKSDGSAELRDALESKLKRYYGIQPSEASYDQMYHSVVLSVKDILMRKRADQHNKVKKTHAKRVYYI